MARSVKLPEIDRRTILSLEFPARLNALRRLKQISQKTVAACVGTSQGMVSDWETGQRAAKLTARQLRNLASLLGVSVTELIG